MNRKPTPPRPALVYGLATTGVLCLAWHAPLMVGITFGAAVFLVVRWVRS